MNIDRRLSVRHYSKVQCLADGSALHTGVLPHFKTTRKESPL